MKPYVITDCGIVNMRDLGGYQAKDGRHVKKGILYRGAAPFGQSEVEKRMFSKRGIHTIFDLRSPIEVNKEPDFIPEGTEYINVSGIPSMDGGKDAEGNVTASGNLDMQSMVMELTKNPEGIAKLKDFMISAYQEIPVKPAAYKELFQVLLRKPEKSILFHCTAGKDRTGVASAFVLQVLGVPMEIIMEDYLLSNQFRKEENEKNLSKIREAISNQEILDLFTEMLTVQEKFLKAAFLSVKEHYGNFINFQEQGLGLTKENVVSLQNWLLEF